MGRGHRRRQRAALRRAARLRRPARRLPGHARRIQAQHARPPGRRLRRRPGHPALSARAADPRAAHPPREGDVQHLHRAGAAGGHGRHVRGLPRAREGWRRSPRACIASPRSSPPACERLGFTLATTRSSTRSPSTRRRAPRRSRRALRRAASTCAASTRRRRHLARRDRPPATTSSALWQLFAGAATALPDIDALDASAPTRCPGRTARARRRSSPTRCSTRTTPRPRCCATCAGWPTRTSRSTAR